MGPPSTSSGQAAQHTAGMTLIFSLPPVGLIRVHLWFHAFRGYKMPKTSITMLNSMADRVFERALDRHVEWGLTHLDLKDRIFDKSIVDLTDDEAGRAASMIADRGLSVYCMSTTLFHANVELGEDLFCGEHLGQIDRTIQVARILQPDLVRLLGAMSERRSEISDAITYVESDHPWLVRHYREAIEKLAAAGFSVTIENECRDCVLSTPQEILDLFAAIDCGEAVNLTWDVQNLWQMGTFPSLDVYRRLKPLLAYYHIKGGISGEGTSDLQWKSSLEDASWPVEDITTLVIADGVSPVICLNGSHGERREGYDYETVTERDLAYLRRNITKADG